MCFLVALCCLIIRTGDQEASPSAKTRGTFNAMLIMEKCPCINFQWFRYFQSPYMSFVMTDEFSVSVIKVTSRIGVLQTSFYLWNDSIIKGV